MRRLVASMLIAIPAHAHSQQPLRGVVFDSLANAPLADATVRVLGAPTTAFAKTDAKGRFRFDSLLIGAVELAVEHPTLDSIGLYELTSRVNHDGKREQKLGVPSFATLWRAICGGPAPIDSAMLYGTVTDAESKAAPNATVIVSWIVASRGGDGKLAQRRMNYETRTDSLGRFTACGLPVDESYTFVARGAAADSTTRVEVQLPARTRRILRQEVMLGAPIIATPVDSTGAPLASGDAAARPALSGPTGVVRGTVMGSDGAPVAGTQIAIRDLPEVRSDSAGHFFLRGVPTGSRELEAIAVGRTPQMLLVNVRARDTAVVNFTLDRVTTLKGVNTAATVLSEFTRSYEERKRTGLGRFRDSSEVERSPSLVTALATFPNVVARIGRGGVPIIRLPKAPSIELNTASGCEARLYIDGRPDVWERTATLQPKDIAWIEVYPRATALPAEFQTPDGSASCGVVAIATKARVAR